jgi:transcriptional regulator with XRE-family HTH domain
MSRERGSRKSTRTQQGDKGTEGPAVPAQNETGISVSLRLREIRAARGLSLKALAQLSGLNINTLSLIENEHTSPSVSTLQQLARSLQVPITQFFESNDRTRKLVHQKQGGRPRITFQHSVMEDMAAGMPRFGAEPILVTLEPGADSGDKLIVHTGREFVYCLDGLIEYAVDDETYPLETGDSLIFEAYLPHRWKNPGSDPARALLVLCSLDERDQPRERHFA